MQKPPEDETLIKLYVDVDGVLTPCKNNTRPRLEEPYTPVEIVCFRTGQSRCVRKRASEVTEEARELMVLRWANGSNFFSAINSQIRRLHTADQEIIKEKLRRLEKPGETFVASSHKRKIRAEDGNLTAATAY
ncbi:hypothetical protein R1sor_020724 [Riccia sorocarpa]|uniref:Uncharacterized protein n=1 Tax=Riccia sorocarpa TaxID=122646 RepID=A0ABD3GFS2_9MARC